MLSQRCTWKILSETSSKLSELVYFDLVPMTEFLVILDLLDRLRSGILHAVFGHSLHIFIYIYISTDRSFLFAMVFA